MSVATDIHNVAVVISPSNKSVHILQRPLVETAFDCGAATSDMATRDESTWKSWKSG